MTFTITLGKFVLSQLPASKLIFLFIYLFCLLSLSYFFNIQDLYNYGNIVSFLKVRRQYECLNFRLGINLKGMQWFSYLILGGFLSDR